MKLIPAIIKYRRHYVLAKQEIQEMKGEGLFLDPRQLEKLGKELEGILVATSPFPPQMEWQRVDGAIKTIQDLYGRVEAYKGIWIASGGSNEVTSDVSQRKILVDRLLEKGVPQKMIRESQGANTYGNVKETIPILNREHIGTLGISSFPLHLDKFALIFNYMKQALKQELTVVGIENPYKEWAPRRLYGLMDRLALAVEREKLGGK